ncbi:hypothetical protein [Mycolicibacterium fortuitum]|uniref:hypothetical protein n=1 Tax=Mycolicibacterium fortuitum TaxID=1766 RepID=UPI003AAFDEC2
MSDTIEIGRHVLILTPTGTFTIAGRRLAGPVDTADKLGKLILWAADKKRGGLQPIPGPSDEPDPARVWVVGGAVRLLTGTPEDSTDNPADHLARTLAPLVDDGWEIRKGSGPAVVLARGRDADRVLVEVLAEQQPWLAAGDDSVTDDPDELGRRLGRWHTAMGVLPAASAAISGARIVDHIMASREGRRGAVVSDPGALPTWVKPEVRTQPAWATDPDQVEREFQHCDEIMCLVQQSPALASAGMLTFGHGQADELDAAAATAAATAAKRPFGQWLVDLPAAKDLDLPKTLPLPHPQMAVDHSVQTWVSTEDLDGLTSAIRDGGAGLDVEKLTISEAVIWPQKTRLLETWAKRLRTALEAFVDDAPMRALVEAAAADYLAALADPDMWAEDMRHHYQPAWAAAIATHIRYRARRAAMRISREYRAWPVYVEGASMVYGPTSPAEGEPPVDLSDTHTRLGRLVTTARAELTQQTILALLLAESVSDVAAALTAVLELPAALNNQSAPDIDVPATATPESSVGAQPQREPDTETTEGEPEPPEPAQPAGEEPTPKTVKRKHRTATAAALGGTPAAVLDADGLWMPDGTKIELAEPVTHIGQVAELAYTYNLGYQLSPARGDKPGYGEPGQIWITEAACRGFGIDVDTLVEAKPKRRDELMREITQGIPFVTEAINDGWRLGGAKDEDTATWLGTWTRVFPADKKRKGVWVTVIPGMACDGDSFQDVKNIVILVDKKTDDGIAVSAPAPIARRLQLFADAHRFPFKLNAGVTAIDLMVACRPKGTTIADWRNGPLAPSTFDVPFTVNDIERDFNWTRTLTEDERNRRYVHAYDRGGSYPAAIAGLELPIGDPVHYPDGSVFEDPAKLKQLLKAPGLVTIVVPEPQDWRVPFLLNPAGLQVTTPKPVTTARLDRAVQLGYNPTIVEAYTWPDHARVLNGWYERIRDASLALDTDDPDAQAAREQSKMVRSVGIGLMGSDPNLKGKTGYDPMKRLSIVGKASANIAYRFEQIGQDTGHWPAAAEKDTVLYISDNPDPKAAWPGKPENWGRGFGQYKHEGSALLADHIEYLNGGAYKGKAALLDPEEWAELMPTLDTPADAKEGN